MGKNGQQENMLAKGMKRGEVNPEQTHKIMQTVKVEEGAQDQASVAGESLLDMAARPAKVLILLVC